jgi:hypothetical protein
MRGFNAHVQMYSERSQLAPQQYFSRARLSAVQGTSQHVKRSPLECRGHHCRPLLDIVLLQVPLQLH